jgi:hypothetical protein
MSASPKKDKRRTYTLRTKVLTTSLKQVRQQFKKDKTDPKKGSQWAGGFVDVFQGVRALLRLLRDCCACSLLMLQHSM